MNNSSGKHLWTLFGLSAAGLIFSGYLSAVKLLSRNCAFGEACPYFLGYPACWYGFAMYLVMFAAVSMALTGKAAARTAFKWTATVSVLGIIFAGSFFVQEVAQSNFTGMLGLSTCGYGLIFYVLIFAASLVAWRRISKDR